MGGPFSLRRLSPLGSPAGGAGQTQMAALGMFPCCLDGFAVQKTGLFFFCVCRYPCINNTALDASMRLEYFCNAKGQRDFKSTLAFLASHEARRRMAVFSIQLTRNPYQTGEPRGLSPSGGNSAANLLSLVCPAPYGRGVGVKGHCPLREP